MGLCVSQDMQEGYGNLATGIRHCLTNDDMGTKHQLDYKSKSSPPPVDVVFVVLPPNAPNAPMDGCVPGVCWAPQIAACCFSLSKSLMLFAGPAFAVELDAAEEPDLPRPIDHKSSNAPEEDLVVEVGAGEPAGFEAGMPEL